MFLDLVCVFRIASFIPLYAIHELDRLCNVQFTAADYYDSVTLFVLSDIRITDQLAKWFQRRIFMFTDDHEGHKITAIARMTLWIR